MLDGIRMECHRDREQQLTARRNELRRILAAKDILIRYQPIVRLPDGSVYGYEALLRCGQGQTPRPTALLKTAERLDLLKVGRAKIADFL